MDLIKKYSAEDKCMYYSNNHNDLKNIGFLSLKIALENYFYSYYSIKRELVDYYEYGVSINNFDSVKYTDKYYECCFESIVHFQHFFELIIKDMLEKENPLLAVRANQNHIIFHKLLKGEDICDSDMDSLYSIEFSEALERITKLLSSNRIDNRFKFIKDYNNVLKALNIFRNRTWHRGMFSLKYDSFDEFVGKHILPLVIEIINLEEYSYYEDIWKYSENYIGVDIINEIVIESKSSTVDHTKIALLKELGRAAYIKKDKIVKMRSDEEIKNIISHMLGDEGINIIKSALGSDSEMRVMTCPSCGKDSLIVTFGVGEDIDELCGSGGYQMINRYYEYEDTVECINCTFELNKYVGNLNDYGISFKNFWSAYEII